MDPVMGILLFIHISSVLLWLSPLPILIMIKYLIKKQDDLKVLKNTLSMTKRIPIIGYIASILIVITGTLMAKDIWFNFSKTYLWLALKQIVWLFLFLISPTLIRQNQIKLNKLIDSENSTREDLINAFKKVYQNGHMVDGLIFLNIFFATFLRLTL